MVTLKNANLLKTKAYINGLWCSAGSGKQFPVLNPATHETIGSAPDMDAKDCVIAIEAAEVAQVSWAAMTAKDRASILHRWHDLILENQDDLASLITAEQGKPLAEALGEVIYGATFVDWFAEEARRAYGDVIPHTKDGVRSVVIKQPIGVVAAITPWNFPLAMITRKVAPALAVGCSVVVKPAEDTPLSALALAYLAEEAGIPAGVFNVVTALHGAEIGNTLCASPIVRKLSFTGSTAVGRILMKQCAYTIKKLSLELGGNAPFIVFDDADIDAAVQGSMASKYRNTGQTCVCANRFLVQDTVFDAFAKAFADAISALKQGQGTEKGVNIGPLINQAALDKVERLVSGAVKKGASVLSGGVAVNGPGAFYPPTLLADATSEMEIFGEEIFGPIAVLYRFHDEEEAVKLANDTRAGLAAYVYTRDIGRVWRMGEALDYGMVGINDVAISAAEVPFGGIKESGLGREGSKYGIDEFLELKYLCMGGLSSKH